MAARATHAGRAGPKEQASDRRCAVGRAAIGIGLTAAIARPAPERDGDVAQALRTVLGWTDALWPVAFVGVIVFLLVAIVVLVLVVLSLREKVVPSVREGLSSLWAVTKDRGKRIELFGGNLGTEVLFALALGAVCHPTASTCC